MRNPHWTPLCCVMLLGACHPRQPWTGGASPDSGVDSGEATGVLDCGISVQENTTNAVHFSVDEDALSVQAVVRYTAKNGHGIVRAVALQPSDENPLLRTLNFLPYAGEFDGSLEVDVIASRPDEAPCDTLLLSTAAGSLITKAVPDWLVGRPGVLDAVVYFDSEWENNPHQGVYSLTLYAPEGQGNGHPTGLVVTDPVGTVLEARAFDDDIDVDGWSYTMDTAMDVALRGHSGFMHAATADYGQSNAASVFAAFEPGTGALQVHMANTTDNLHQTFAVDREGATYTLAADTSSGHPQNRVVHFTVEDGGEGVVNPDVIDLLEPGCFLPGISREVYINWIGIDDWVLSGTHVDRGDPDERLSLSFHHDLRKNALTVYTREGVDFGEVIGEDCATTTAVHAVPDVLLSIPDGQDHSTAAYAFPHVTRLASIPSTEGQEQLYKLDYNLGTESASDVAPRMVTSVYALDPTDGAIEQTVCHYQPPHLDGTTLPADVGNEVIARQGGALDVFPGIGPDGQDIVVTYYANMQRTDMWTLQTCTPLRMIQATTQVEGSAPESRWSHVYVDPQQDGTTTVYPAGLE